MENGLLSFLDASRAAARESASEGNRQVRPRADTWLSPLLRRAAAASGHSGDLIHLERGLIRRGGGCFRFLGHFCCGGSSDLGCTEGLAGGLLEQFSLYLLAAVCPYYGARATTGASQTTSGCIFNTLGDKRSGETAEGVGSIDGVHRSTSICTIASAKLSGRRDQRNGGS